MILPLRKSGLYESFHLDSPYLSLLLVPALVTWFEVRIIATCHLVSTIFDILDNTRLTTQCLSLSSLH